MPGWLGLCLMPNTVKEIMKPVGTMVSKNQFSWRAGWPRVLVAARQATGTSVLGRPWGTGGCCQGGKNKVPNVSSRCRRSGREVRAECASYLAMVWKEEDPCLEHSEQCV